jgi:hypothetical protein
MRTRRLATPNDQMKAPTKSIGSVGAIDKAKKSAMPKMMKTMKETISSYIGATFQERVDELIPLYHP